MSRGKEQTVVIRVYKSDRDIYNKWCGKKVCDMPDLHRMMIEYGIRKQQQAFYDSLPRPNKFSDPIIRRKKSKINKNCIHFEGACNN
jgi:hypothetical protein